MSSRALTVLALPLTLVVPLVFAACSSSDETGSAIRRGGGGNGSLNTGASGNGGPINPGTGGAGLAVDPNNGTGGASTCGQVLQVTYRDFKGAGEPGGHSDFEASARNVTQTDGKIYKGWNDVGCELVQTTLGADGKPIAYTGKPDENDGLGVPVGAGRQRRAVSGPGCWSESNPNATGVCGIGICEKWIFKPPTWSIKDSSSFAQWYSTTRTSTWRFRAS